MSFLPQPTALVDAAKAKGLYREIATGGYERLLQLLGVHDESVIDPDKCASVGVRWILKNVKKFFAMDGMDIRVFVYDQSRCHDLRHLLSSSAFLRAISDLHERQYAFRLIYGQQGAIAGWVASALRVGLSKAFLGSRIVDRLRVCVAGSVDNKELLREVEYFLGEEGHGPTSVGNPDGLGPGRLEFAEAGRMWSVLDDEQFAEALRICMTPLMDAVLGASWHSVRVKLHHNQLLLDALFKQAVATLTEMSEVSLRVVSKLSIDRRLAILENLDPLPATRYVTGWWEDRVPAFRLLLETFFDMTVGRARLLSSDEKKYDPFSYLFELVDPLVLRREFYDFCRYRGISTSGNGAYDFVQIRLSGSRGAAGYVKGVVVVWVNDGRPQARVNIERVRYVQSWGSLYTPVDGECVVFKKDGEQLADGLIAVDFVPYDFSYDPYD